MTKIAKNHMNFNKIKCVFAFFKFDLSFFVTLFIAIIIDEVPLYFCFVFFTVLHELSHFFVAKHYGYLARQIHLNFFGASLEGLDDFTLKDEIKIILAGPLLNLFFLIFCCLMFWFFPVSYNFLYEILVANFAIFAFNFLPIFPLDSGRLILGLYSKKYNREVALKKTKNISMFFLFFLFLIYLISFFYEFNFTLGFVCVNLTVLLFKETKNTSYKRSLFVKRKLKLLRRGLLERNIYVNDSTPDYALYKFIDDYHFINFFFVNENFEVTDTLSEIELYKKNNLFG